MARYPPVGSIFFVGRRPWLSGLMLLTREFRDNVRSVGPLTSVLVLWVSGIRGGVTMYCFRMRILLLDLHTVEIRTSRRF